MRDYRRTTPFNSNVSRGSNNTTEVCNMNDIELVLKAMEDLRQSIMKSNEEITRNLYDIQREQLNIRKELIAIQREEMNLKIDAIKGMKEITKNDDIDFLKQIDAIDNEYLDKSIERARKIQELHNEAIFK